MDQRKAKNCARQTDDRLSCIAIWLPQPYSIAVGLLIQGSSLLALFHRLSAFFRCHGALARLRMQVPRLINDDKATAPLRRTLTPSQEAIQYDTEYRTLAESEGCNSIKPSWHRGTPPIAGSPSVWSKTDNLPGTPNEDDAHRLSVYTKRALPEDVNEYSGGRRTPSPTRVSFNAEKAPTSSTSAPVAIPAGRSQ